MPVTYTRQQLLARGAQQLEDNGRFFLFYDPSSDKDYVWDKNSQTVHDTLGQDPMISLFQLLEYREVLILLVSKMARPSYTQLSSGEISALQGS